MKKIESFKNKTETSQHTNLSFIDSGGGTATIHDKVTTMCILPEFTEKQIILIKQIIDNGFNEFPSSYKILSRQLKNKVGERTIRDFIEILKSNAMIDRIHRKLLHGTKEHSLSDKRYYFFKLNEKGLSEARNQRTAKHFKKSLFQTTLW